MALALLERPDPPVDETELLGLPDALEQLALLVEQMDLEAYNRRLGPNDRTIAERVAGLARSVDALVASSDSRVIVYDAAHDLLREADGRADARRLRRLRSDARARRDVRGDTPIWVVQAIGPLGEMDCGWSTFGAELAFVVNRAIEEQQQIVRIVARFRMCVPDGFGLLPMPRLACRSLPPAAAPLLNLLDKLAAVIEGMPPEIYTARPQTSASGTIGQHVRHCLDHIRALVHVEPGDTLSYDHRERGTTIETDPLEARRDVVRLKSAAARWSAKPLGETVRVQSLLSAGGTPTVAASTLARELAFVINHTIHHQALIAVLMAWHGCAVADGFGYAPSTPRPH